MFSILDNIGAFERFTGQTLSALLGIVRGWSPYGGRLRKRKKSYAKHRKETRDGQARYGRGSCLPIAQLPLTRNSV
ncbi:hypothetical protein, partial [Cupriavidus cauae]|uniref:hypothetical protein n=1 Tax=Cupriavidus cauae TaxID=2608999 RepID=UPI001CC20A2E